ncbi:MAG: phosphoribosylglycinamide formyltransferase 1 [Hyphomonadaceae bacterium]|nr:MAG: phosphoribosylglycinamide formyltransferase 1 [Hyphomonadaceae bacterium]
MNAKKRKIKVVILASGSGSNFGALIDYAQNHDANYEIVGLIVNVPNVFALSRAQNHNIPAMTIDHTLFVARTEFEIELQKTLEEMGAELVVCAGFMRILGGGFVAKWEGRIINIHPSLLPKYKGLRTHERAIAAGDKEGGCTVHFVNAGVDEGEIIAQVKVPILLDDDANSLAARVLIEEHLLYPKCVDKIALGLRN